MTLPELLDLRRTEQLFEDVKIDKSLAIFCGKTLFEEISFQEKQHYQFLKALFLIYLNNQSIQLNDIPQLNSILKEISIIEKTV